MASLWPAAMAMAPGGFPRRGIQGRVASFGQAAQTRRCRAQFAQDQCAFVVLVAPCPSATCICGRQVALMQGARTLGAVIVGRCGWGIVTRRKMAALEWISLTRGVPRARAPVRAANAVAAMAGQQPEPRPQESLVSSSSPQCLTCRKMSLVSSSSLRQRLRHLQITHRWTARLASTRRRLHHLQITHQWMARLASNRQHLRQLQITRPRSVLAGSGGGTQWLGCRTDKDT